MLKRDIEREVRRKEVTDVINGQSKDITILKTALTKINKGIVAYKQEDGAEKREWRQFLMFLLKTQADLSKSIR